MRGTRRNAVAAIAFSEQDAAWRFIKYLLEPKSHLGTGYFPVVSGVLNSPKVGQAHTKNSNFTTAIKQLERSKTDATLSRHNASVAK